MPTDHRAELKEVRTFPSLVRYLRDQMRWPINGGDFEELTFEYTPEELGIDAKNAAKIQEIKRLRPLAPNQPWGIFFVKFEPKRLPVVALRRILKQVALKKRASANKAERQAWAADDLLFVSNYGEGEGRQISFAHFSTPKDGQDLPTLKVLGWDNKDTALHLDAVAKELTEKLAWPEDGTDANTWREQWRTAFTLRHREVITTSKELSLRLAELARAIHDRIKTALAIETDKGPLTKLMKAFQQALVHDLDADGFADMYAQTIAYGLLSARIADPHRKTADDFAAHMRTNPFLRELMETFLHIGGRRGKAGGTGIDFDELGVSEVVELLDDANMEAVVRDFGDKNPQEDPVIHFYELFLSAYNKKLKIQRGVFYTPQPVVSYIVRSVHELLQTEFGLADGLADTITWGEMLKRHPGLKLPPLTDEPGEKRTVSPDEPFVQILDPATGTATFLVEVVDVIYRTLAAKWSQKGFTNAQQRAAWNDYVPKHLLPRLHAFELMMAPYAIAHMKIGLKLAETGYDFGVEERARIYLTNALEPWVKQLPLIGFDALAHEAAAVNEVKRLTRFTVVIGNPPYSLYGQLNKIPFILNLLDDYKRGLDEKKLNLDDDFIKFIRLAQWEIDASECGVVGFITNNTYIDGITHRQMRAALRDSFTRIYALDLHGSSSKKEICPDGSKDENVFDIQQGVGISLFVSKPGALSKIFHADAWGVRVAKYSKLGQESISSTNWSTLTPRPPYCFFVPKDFKNSDEYSACPSLLDIFTVNGPGVKTERDAVSIHWSLPELKQAVKAFKELPEVQLRKTFELAPDSRDWKVKNAKADVIKNDRPSCYTRISYRPFDTRHIWYSGQTRGFVGTPGYPVMQHMLQPDALGLVGMRQYEYDVPDYCYVFVSRFLIDNRIFVSNRGIANIFPLYFHEESKDDQPSLLLSERTNLTSVFIRELCDSLNMKRRPLSDSPVDLTPEDILHYAYAVFHSPGYRSRYAEFLKIDFPRLPLTGNLELFRALARLGGELVPLHLLESKTLDKPRTEFVGSPKTTIEKISYDNGTVFIDKAKTTGFRGVSEAVWDFHIGGYQVCEKWLKDRKGRTPSKDDISHYHKVVIALSETIRLMGEIDAVIDKHGGWPAAFQTGEAMDAKANVVPFRPRIVEPKPEERYVNCVPLVPLKAAAGAFSDPQHIEDDGFEWVAIESRHRLRPGMFVAQVIGKSMEPAIPEGSYCLFSSPVAGTRQGKTVLVQLTDATDPETGQRYTVKRYESEKAKKGDSWRHTRITLKPLNAEFAPIVLTGVEDGLVQVIAEFIEIYKVSSC